MIKTVGVGRGLFIIVVLLLGWPGVVCGEPDTRGGGVTSSGSPTKLSLGTYRGLVIGINSYKGSWSPLKAARPDAEAIYSKLVSEYGFDKANIQLLVDEQATRSNIKKALYQLRRKTQKNDLVFIYFAGHGSSVGDPKDPDESCWIAYDSETPQGSCEDALEHPTIISLTKKMKSRHTLLLADACFSGDLVQGLRAGGGNRGNVALDYHEPLKRNSREVLTSGYQGTPVADDEGSGHSPFASAILARLADARAYVKTSDLKQAVIDTYRNGIENRPEHAFLAGHKPGGEFVFIRPAEQAKLRGVEHAAPSTNGSAETNPYGDLIAAQQQSRGADADELSRQFHEKKVAAEWATVQMIASRGERFGRRAIERFLSRFQNHKLGNPHEAEARELLAELDPASTVDMPDVGMTNADVLLYMPSRSKRDSVVGRPEIEDVSKFLKGKGYGVLALYPYVRARRGRLARAYRNGQIQHYPGDEKAANALKRVLIERYPRIELLELQGNIPTYGGQFEILLPGN